MTENRNDTGLPRTTLAVPADQVHEVVSRFDSAWQRGQAPRLVDFLETPDCRQPEVTAELVRVDMQQRTRLGESVRLDSYLPDVPELLNSPLELISLILDEYWLRTEAGQQVDFEEYRSRFPEHAETIRTELGLTDDLPQAVDSDTATVIRAQEAGLHGRLESEHGDEAEPENSPDVCASSELQPGTVLGEFEIERLLGRGGVSKVFLARQISLNRPVALKVTLRDEDDERASDEGRAMAAVVHDHIVPVHTELRIGKRHVLAMGYIAGPALSQFLDALRLTAGKRWLKRSEAECRQVIADLSEAQPANPIQSKNAGRRLSHFAAQTVRDLARALAHAHQSGILHCDIKPANVLFSPDGRALLTDFNVSVRKESDSAEDQAIPAGGTLMYMAPEQLALLTGSQVSRVDERSDIYSLGLVLFELLTGSWPFADENLSDRIVVAAGQLQANRLSSDLIYPRDDAAPPSPLRAIVETCLQPLPDDRYQTADELAEDLDCWLRDRPLKTVRDSDSVASILRRIPRYKVALLTGAVCVLMALILIRGQGSAVTNNRTANDSTGVSTSKRLAAARDAVALSEEGRLHVEMKDFAAAIPVLERAVNLNPELAPAWHNLGVAQFRLSEFGRAEASFDRVIELGNRSGLVYSHRGAARFALGDVAGADADFAEAMRIARPTERAEVALNMRTFQERRQSQMEEQAGDVRAGKAAPR